MANYPVPYQNNWNYSGVGQQMYPQYPQPVQQTQSFASQMPVEGEIKWVDGEVGAKAYQIPAGTTKPIALWDTNDTVIYIKSMSPMGMPNPIQKAHYTLEEKTASPMSGNTQPATQDMTQYVRKDDMDRMKQELMDAINSANTSGANAARRNVKGET